MVSFGKFPPISIREGLFNSIFLRSVLFGGMCNGFVFLGIGLLEIDLLDATGLFDFRGGSQVIKGL
jgi:hypothetical protein